MLNMLNMLKHAKHAKHANMLNMLNMLNLLKNIPALRAKGLHRLMLPHCGLLRLRDIRKHVRDRRTS